jgi:hypothetical protein
MSIKVFYSDAEHIGRLIESMTRGVDAGSFTVQHNGNPVMRSDRGPHDRINDGKWTMEEVRNATPISASPNEPTASRTRPAARQSKVRPKSYLDNLFYGSV